ncbi:hypothetical protein Tco_1312798 [Tanacetum coccineum]
METEPRNLTVKNNYLAAYTQRFQQLTMLCTKMVPEEEDPTKEDWRSVQRDNHRQLPPFKRPNVEVNKVGAFDPKNSVRSNLHSSNSEGSSSESEGRQPLVLSVECKDIYKNDCRPKGLKEQKNLNKAGNKMDLVKQEESICASEEL